MAVKNFFDRLRVNFKPNFFILINYFKKIEEELDFEFKVVHFFKSNFIL